MDIVLDSDYLADLLGQYFNPEMADRGAKAFRADGNISRSLAQELNRIVAASEHGIGDLVIASAFAFVEISRKWDALAGGRFETHEMHAFLCDHPEWFTVAPVDEDLLPFFAGTEVGVYLGTRWEQIEWTDAVHVATLRSRDESAALATRDTRIKAILELEGRTVL